MKFDLEMYLTWYKEQLERCKDLESMIRITTEHKHLMEILKCFESKED